MEAIETQRIDHQAELAKIEPGSRAERLELLVGHALDVIEQTLTMDIPRDIDNVRLLRLQQDAAISIIGTQVKVASEMLRSQQSSQQMQVILAALEAAKAEM